MVFKGVTATQKNGFLTFLTTHGIAPNAYAISNGSACTSSSYTPSLLSWCHLTPEVDWEAVAVAVAGRMMR